VKDVNVKTKTAEGEEIACYDIVKPFLEGVLEG
jgi:hypothetical protein